MAKADEVDEKEVNRLIKENLDLSDEDDKEESSNLVKPIKVIIENGGIKNDSAPAVFLEKYVKPFELDWRREIVVRNACDESSGASKGRDVYYHTPTGKKLRSIREVEVYLNQSNIANLSAENFTFQKTAVYHMPLEFTRQAGKTKVSEKRNMTSPLPAAKKAKLKVASSPKKDASVSTSPMPAPVPPVTVVPEKSELRRTRGIKVNIQKLLSPTSTTVYTSPDSSKPKVLKTFVKKSLFKCSSSCRNQSSLSFVLCTKCNVKKHRDCVSRKGVVPKKYVCEKCLPKVIEPALPPLPKLTPCATKDNSPKSTTTSTNFKNARVMPQLSPGNLNVVRPASSLGNSQVGAVTHPRPIMKSGNVLPHPSAALPVGSVINSQIPYLSNQVASLVTPAGVNPGVSSNSSQVLTAMQQILNPSLPYSLSVMRVMPDKDSGLVTHASPLATKTASHGLISTPVMTPRPQPISAAATNAPAYPETPVLLPPKKGELSHQVLQIPQSLFQSIIPEKEIVLKLKDRSIIIPPAHWNYGPNDNLTIQLPGLTTDIDGKLNLSSVSSSGELILQQQGANVKDGKSYGVTLFESHKTRGLVELNTMGFILGWRQVFEYLHLNYLYCLSQTCSSAHFLMSHAKSMAKFSVDCNTVRNWLLFEEKTAAGVCDLTLLNCDMKVLPYLRATKSLRSLYLDNIGNQMLECVNQEAMCCLYLKGNLGKLNFHLISAFSKLEKLTLEGKLGEGTFSSLEKLQRLQHLSLKISGHFPIISLGELLCRLKSLMVRDCSTWAREEFESLKDMIFLEKLHLGTLPCLDGCYGSMLDAMGNLRDVRFDDMVVSNDLTSSDLKYDSIEKLHLKTSLIPSEFRQKHLPNAILWFKKMPKLTRLHWDILSLSTSDAIPYDSCHATKSINFLSDWISTSLLDAHISVRVVASSDERKLPDGFFIKSIST